MFYMFGFVSSLLMMRKGSSVLFLIGLLLEEFWNNVYVRRILSL
jgi:hypothetical protein